MDVARVLTRSLEVPDPEGGIAPLCASQADIERTLAHYTASDNWHNLKLTMPPALESAWSEHAARQAIPLQRWGVLLALSFFTTYFGYTFFFYTKQFDPILVTVFILFGAPGNMALLLATMFKNGWRWTRDIAFYGALWHTIGMILFYQRAGELGLIVPTEILFTQIVFDLFVLGVGYARGALLALFAVMVGPYAASKMMASDHATVTMVFSMMGGTVIGIIGAYLLERGQRISWLRAQLLTMAAETDGLTGLLNRTAFFSRMSVMLKQADRTIEPCTLVYFDVDHFKKYNDRFGHPEGDRCLRGVARELAKTGRRPLDLVGRIGGEEFGVLLTGCDLAHARQIAEDLRLRIRAILNPAGESVTASMGAVSYRVGSDTLESVVRRADTALYRAKHDGRDRVEAEESLSATPA